MAIRDVENYDRFCRVVISMPVGGRFGQRTFWPGRFGLGRFGLGRFGQLFFEERTFWLNIFKKK